MSSGKKDPAGSAENPLLSRFSNSKLAMHVGRLNAKHAPNKVETVAPALDSVESLPQPKKKKSKKAAVPIVNTNSSDVEELLKHPRTRFSDEEKRQIAQVLEAIKRATGSRPAFAHVDKAMWALLFQALIPEDERQDPAMEHRQYAPHLKYPQKGNKLAEANFLDKLGGFIHRIFRNTPIADLSWKTTNTNR